MPAARGSWGGGLRAALPLSKVVSWRLVTSKAQLSHFTLLEMLMTG